MLFSVLESFSFFFFSFHGIIFCYINAPVVVFSNSEKFMTFIFNFLLESYSLLELEMYTTLKWIASKGICKWMFWLNAFPAQGGLLPARGRQLASTSFYMTFFLCSGRVTSCYFNGRKLLSSFCDLKRMLFAWLLKESSRSWLWCGLLSLNISI